MRSPRLLVVLGLIAAFTVVLAVAMWRRDVAPSETKRSGAVEAVRPAVVETPTRQDFSPPAPKTLPRANDVDAFYARFDSADNLLTFIAEMHAAANAGNSAAMYFLALALKRCTFEYGVYFTGQGRGLTLDEVLVIHAGGALPEDYLRKLHRQCEPTRTADLKSFGDPDTWLERAVAERMPLAQIWKARQLAAYSSLGRDEEKVDEARLLTRAALKSKNPLVLIQVSQVLPLLQEAAPVREIESGAWMLVACRRGLDCSLNNIWFQLACREDRNCQPYDSAEDLVRRRLGNNFDAADERAREIDAALDADRFDDLAP